MIQHLIFILHDSIENSVFQGQILHPLLNKKETDKNLTITLISFENKQYTKAKLKKIINTNLINCILLKKNRYLGMKSLYPLIQALKKQLTSFNHYKLIARGPIAGYIAQKAVNPTQCAQLTIQARGLLTHEYAYAHKNSSVLLRWLHALRARQYTAIERTIYNTKKNLIPTTIEAVSPALKNYLIAQYNTDSSRITIAQHDIPKALPREKKDTARTRIRTQLGISDTAMVYCYNGSIKPWQCPEMVLKTFCMVLEKNNNAHLLILTQNKTEFLDLLTQHPLKQNNYTLLSIAHTQVLDYLSACDVGFLFREPHVINWTSRPTKLLEYQAAGLEIMHNNTVALLAEKLEQ